MKMTARRNAIVSSLLVFAAMAASGARGAEVKDGVDWAAFLKRQDMVWNKVPSRWEEGAFMGNGLLGANLYTTEDGKYVTFPIGRSDVVLKAARIPIGDLVLKTVGTVTGGHFRLDLWNGEVTGEIETTKGKVEVRAFTHAHEMVQVIELTPDAGEQGAAWEWAPGPAMDPVAIAKKQPIPEAERGVPAARGESEGATFSSQPLRTGGGHTAAWTEVKRGDGARVTYLSVGYSTAQDNTGKEEAIAAVNKAKAEGLESLVKSHRDWWHAYWPESFISIPDARLESFYWVQMYKLASATRSDREVIDLMGPWFRSTPWPRIWWNLNIELTYWPIYTANRLELGDPFCKILDDHKEQLAKNTKKYSADSYGIGRSCSYDLVRNIGPEIGNLPWALHNYYLQYRYSMDDAMLRDRLFPLLKGSINYYLHILKQGQDGKLHIPLGLSPEYPGQPSPDPDCNYDLALLRWGCETLLATCERLKIADPLIPKWKDTLANLTPYPTDENGLKISASVSVEESHRHYSHMMMIYPLHLMTPDKPEDLALINKTFEHWVSMPKAFRGFSFTGASSISSLLGKGDDAAKWMENWFTTDSKYKVTPNTMYVEAGPVMESPLSGAAAVNDMLLQSWGGKLRVFPGVASSWKDVAFAHLRGEGAFLVTASRKDGKTAFVQVESLAGEPCRLVTDMENPGVNGVALRKGEDGAYVLDLKKGETTVVTPGGASAELTVAPVATDPSGWNYWGVK